MGYQPGNPADCVCGQHLLPWRKTPPVGYKTLYFNELIHFDGYAEWVSGFAKSLLKGVSRRGDAPFNSLPVYGAAYRLAVETTQMASRLERNYRYSLGEDVRRGTKHALLRITLAGKGEDRLDNIRPRPPGHHRSPHTRDYPVFVSLIQNKTLTLSGHKLICHERIASDISGRCQNYQTGHP